MSGATAPTATCCWPACRRPGSTASRRPKGAFYLYCDVAHLTNDSREFCRRMLGEAGVATTPGRRLRSRARFRHLAHLLRRLDRRNGRGGAAAEGMETVVRLVAAAALLAALAAAPAFAKDDAKISAAEHDMKGAYAALLGTLSECRQAAPRARPGALARQSPGVRRERRAEGRLPGVPLPRRAPPSSGCSPMGRIPSSASKPSSNPAS